MTIPAFLTSIRGRYAGLDSDGNFVARLGAKAAKFISDLNAATTSSNISNGGVSTISSTAAQSITMDAPGTGVEKTIACVTTSTSTAARTVALASGTIQSTASSTYTTMTFNATGQAIRLVGLSTARALVVANAGVTLS